MTTNLLMVENWLGIEMLAIIYTWTKSADWDIVAENGPTRAAKHFSKVMNKKFQNQLRGGWKQEIARTSRLQKQWEYTSYPTKVQVRPVLLGQMLDKAVQDYITIIRVVGGVVNIAVVMTAAEGIKAAQDWALLVQHGSNASVSCSPNNLQRQDRAIPP